jgi:hypothetical protein
MLCLKLRLHPRISAIDEYPRRPQGVCRDGELANGKDAATGFTELYASFHDATTYAEAS